MPCHHDCNQGRHCDGSCLDDAPRPARGFGPLSMAGWFWLVYLCFLAFLTWGVFA
ncbi:MAG: hypothetical protein M0Z99_20770 [Betaproteobacteria bacterium]|nr:hypothetical protein [Betaproteobacteria bacterium]